MKKETIAKHTPGPWRTVITGDRYTKVATDRGKLLIDLEFSGAHHGEDCGNARLIAAAPDLLSLLRIAIEEITGPDYDGTVSERTLNDMKDVIAKAEGH